MTDLAPSELDAMSPRTSFSALGVPPPPMDDLEELVTVMRSSLKVLGHTFDTLGEQTAHVTTLPSAVENAHQLTQLRQQLVAADRQHEDRIQELKALLREVVRAKINDFLTHHLQHTIRDRISARVKERVARQLHEHIPDALRIQVDEHREQIADVKKNLVNSEARHHNSLLTASNLHGPLKPLVCANGEVSELFPSTMAKLFAMSASGVKELNNHYGLAQEGDTRERRINKFLGFIGVQIQVIPASKGSAQAPLLTVG